MLDRSQQPEISTFKNVHLNFPHPITLNNGIPMWIVGDGEDEVVRINVYMGGGAFEEAKPLLANLTGLLCLEGNDKMSASEIAEAMDYYGAVKSSQSFDHCTLVSISSTSRNFEPVLNILCRCIMHPSFSEQECMLFQQRLALRALKLLFGAMDPAAS